MNNKKRERVFFDENRKFSGPATGARSIVTGLDMKASKISINSWQINFQHVHVPDLIILLLENGCDWGDIKTMSPRKEINI